MGAARSPTLGPETQQTAVRYDDSFQQFTSDDEAWLNRWEREGTKELAVEALRLYRSGVAKPQPGPRRA